MTKYRARKTIIDGITFDSKAEGNRYLALRARLQAGEIRDLTIHPRYLILDPFKHRGKQYRATHYEADFSYYENHVEIVEDVKGVKTAVFRLKMKLFLYWYPGIDFRIIDAKDYR